MHPQLPTDIWYRIARFSPPETLSALSQVSTTFNKLATHRTHFARETSIPDLPVVQAYRREAALHHPPRQICTTVKDITGIFRANDCALLHDSRNNTLVAFPTGHIFPISDGRRYVKKDWCIPLSRENVGFVTASRKELCVFDLSSGETCCVPLLKNGTLFRKSCPVLLAGNHGEWLLQRTDESLVLCDPCNGVIKRSIDVPNDITLVTGELSISHGGTCVGYATNTVEKGVRTVHVHGFDGVKTEFQLSEEEVLEHVLRSEDGLTHVVITRRENATLRHFIASRGSTVWYGDLDNITAPRLSENGNMITESRAVPLKLVRNCKELTVCVILNEDTSVQNVSIRGVKMHSRVVWARRIRGYILALVVHCVKMNKLQMVKITYGKSTRKKILKEWVIPGIRKIQMIADHYILAASDSKELHLLHFDRFCNGAGGAYACPLVGLFTYCYFPDQFREGGDDDVREGKRRRIDDEAHDCVDWV